MRVTLILAAALALPGGAQAATPRLYVVAETPVQVMGSGFHSGEKVTVRMSVSGSGTFARTVTATGAGKITARFSGHSLGSCAAYTVTAVGNIGSRVTKKIAIPPACGIDTGP